MKKNENSFIQDEIINLESMKIEYKDKNELVTSIGDYINLLLEIHDKIYKDGFKQN